jgi:hypothetical protein
MFGFFIISFFVCFLVVAFVLVLPGDTGCFLFLPENLGGVAKKLMGSELAADYADDTDGIRVGRWPFIP